MKKIYLQYNWVQFRGEWCVRSIEVYDATKQEFFIKKEYEVPLDEEKVKDIRLVDFFNANDVLENKR